MNQKMKNLFVINITGLFFVGATLLILAYRGEEKEHFVDYVLLPVLSILLFLLLFGFYRNKSIEKKMMSIILLFLLCCEIVALLEMLSYWLIVSSLPLLSVFGLTTLILLVIINSLYLYINAGNIKSTLSS